MRIMPKYDLSVSQGWFHYNATVLHDYDNDQYS